MPYIEPSSNVMILRGVPLDANREHTVWFDTPIDQYNWFKKYQPSSRGGFNFYLSAQSYIREHTEAIRVGIPYKYLYDCNYLVFTNPDYENRRFYCFIDWCEYVNETVTIIHYSMDVIQSYMFDFDVKPCLVEREHTASDKVGENIVAEGLDVGEYINAKNLSSNGYLNLRITSSLCYIVISSKDILSRAISPTAPLSDVDAKPVGRTYNGTGVFVATTPERLGQLLKGAQTVPDSIAAVFPFPECLIDWECVEWGLGSPDSGMGRIYDVGTRSSAANISNETTVKYTLFSGAEHICRYGFVINKIDGQPIDGYTPFNNKLYTAPFCWSEINDNNGHAMMLRPDRFAGNKIEFGFCSSITAEPKVMCYAKNYNGAINNYENNVVMSGAFPYAAWQYDVFKKWLNENGASLSLAFVQGMAESYLNYNAMAIGKITQSASVSDTAMTITKKVRPMKRTIHTDSTSSSTVKNLNPYEQANSGASGIMKCASVMANVADHSAIPNEIRGQVNNGSVNISNDINDFFYYLKTVRADYAQKIDEYFSRFGYAVNQIKLPNFFDPNGHKRPRWNYVKTADAKVECKPQKYFNSNIEEAIENILNRGITFWNKDVEMFDYTQTSSVNNKPTP